MAWGRPKAPPGIKPIKLPKLARRAAKAERLILAMTVQDRAAALAAVETIAAAITGLKNLPDELADELGALVVDFLVEMNMPGLIRKPSPAALVRQIIDGAPTLLGPHRARIEQVTGAIPE